MCRMIYTVSILFISFIVNTSSFKLPVDLADATKLAQLRDNCIEESGIDKKLLDRPNILKSDEDGDALGTHQAHCFLKCLAMNLGYVNDKGEVNFDNIQKEFDITADHESIVVAKQCAEDNEQEDICERVAMIQHCVTESIAKHLPPTRK